MPSWSSTTLRRRERLGAGRSATASAIVGIARPVEAAPGHQLDGPCRARVEPVAVELDLVHPVAGGGGAIGQRGEARRDEVGQVGLWRAADVATGAFERLGSALPPRACARFRPAGARRLRSTLFCARSPGASLRGAVSCSRAAAPALGVGGDRPWRRGCRARPLSTRDPACRPAATERGGPLGCPVARRGSAASCGLISSQLSRFSPGRRCMRTRCQPPLSFSP